MESIDLYSYQTSNGVVVPNTSGIRTLVENIFKTAFQDDSFSVDPETPQGRIIEAITLMFVDVLRVCAINANGFNPSQAVGAYLDNLGQLFGISRLPNQSDENYRESLKSSYSNTSGYALAVRRALLAVDGVTSVCVLDNGSADPAVLPNSNNGISVSPHSVFICVAGGQNADIAKAVFDTISAGCGFEHSDEYGTPVDQTVEDDSTNTSKTIYFYRPTSVATLYSVTVRDDVYTGEDIVADTRNAIAKYVNDHATNYTVTKGDIVSAISAYGTGIVCTDVSIFADGLPIDELAIRPFEVVNVDPTSAEQITVNVT